jgi:alpha-L-arabinofuranosidase
LQPQEEEKKEDTQPESFDWLFCNLNGDINHQLQVQLSYVKNRDTKLLNIEVDIMNLEKWFDGRKFELERIYRATTDGFSNSNFRSKAHMKENVVIVVESEHGKKFGGYSSSVILETNQENVCLLDKRSFIFSLSHQTKHKLVIGKEISAVGYGPGYLIAFGGRD